MGDVTSGPRCTGDASRRNSALRSDEPGRSRDVADSVLRSSLAMMMSPGTSSGASAPATPTSATAVCSSSRAASLAPERARALTTGADDRVRASEGERLNAQRCEDLELSRWNHPASRSARAP